MVLGGERERGTERERGGGGGGGGDPQENLAGIQLEPSPDHPIILARHSYLQG